MATWGTLCLLLLIIHASHAQDSCSTLLLSGSTHQPNKLGLFHRQPTIYNDRYIYKHQCVELYLFYVEAPSSSFWIVGPEIGRKAGFLMSLESTASPLSITSSWRSWNDELQIWMDDRVDITCQVPCLSVTVFGEFDGEYQILPDQEGGRPAYYNQQLQTYIYYIPGDFTCPRWVIGDELGAASYSAFIFSSQVSITPTANIWNVRTPNVHTANITILCTEIIPPACGERIVTDVAGPLLLYGNDAYYGKWSSMASLTREDGVHKCGAVLISDKHVLTAAHCFIRSFSPNETIKVGAYNLDDPESTALEIGIESVFVHPDFYWTETPFEIYNDVAILELKSPVEFNAYIQPACLPRSQNEPLRVTSATGTSDSLYTECHLMGWGRTSYQGPVGGKLQDVLVETMYDMDVCGEAFYSVYKSWMKDSNGVCAYPGGLGKMCQGDSGSPMMCKHSLDNRWYVMGIGSWAFITCLERQVPSVYVPMDRYVDWINEITNY